MSNQWTGGQYSLFRVVLGTYLLIHFAPISSRLADVENAIGRLPASVNPLFHFFPNLLLWNDSPWLVVACIGSAALASAFLIIGFKDRVVAAWLWYVISCLAGIDALAAHPDLQLVKWVLLAHAFVPASPYGSLAASGRADPAGGWRMPKAVFAAAWILISLLYSYNGFITLFNPRAGEILPLLSIAQNHFPESNLFHDRLVDAPLFIHRIANFWIGGVALLFAPLALIDSTRRWLWAAMLINFCVLFLANLGEFSLALFLVHAVIFDPGWIRPSKTTDTDTVFYDGHCGLCHSTVRFLLAEDSRATFRFAPLQSETFAHALTTEQRRHVPDSMVVKTRDGRLFTSSAAVAYVLKRMGGFWRMAGTLLSAIPQGLRDRGYRFIASIRHRLFKSPPAACPKIPLYLRERFINGA
jgi:predicted DCC family thiol-disulfide oxidoreductase YuxK